MSNTINPIKNYLSISLSGKDWENIHLMLKVVISAYRIVRARSYFPFSLAVFSKFFLDEHVMFCTLRGKKTIQALCCHEEGTPAVSEPGPVQHSFIYVANVFSQSNTCL